MNKIVYKVSYTWQVFGPESLVQGAFTISDSLNSTDPTRETELSIKETRLNLKKDWYVHYVLRL